MEKFTVEVQQEPDPRWRKITAKSYEMTYTIEIPWDAGDAYVTAASEMARQALAYHIEKRKLGE